VVKYRLISIFKELASRIKENEQRKGRCKLSLSEFLDIAARHPTHIPASIQTTRRISKNDVSSHRKTKENSTRLHNNLVESRVSTKINLDPKVNLEKDAIAIAVYSTEIKVTNSENGCLINGRIKEKEKVLSNTCSCKYKDKEDSINERYKGECSQRRMFMMERC
jgi:hypothetical protein